MKLNVPIERLRQCRVFVATPMYGGQCSGQFAQSMQSLQSAFARHEVPLNVYYLSNESLITRARNYCVDEFLRSGATHLMFIDSDIGFNGNDILGMLGMTVSNEPNDYDIVGGPYPKKTVSWEKIRLAVDKGYGDPQNPNSELRNPDILAKFVGDYVFNPVKGTNTFAIAEPVEVLELGTGFMLVRRETFLKFQERYPDYKIRPDHVRTAHFDGSRLIHQFFQAEIDKPDPFRYFAPALEKISKSGENFNAKAEAAKAMREYAEAKEKASLRYLSEDYWFCQKARAIGLKTWLCPWIQLQHVGSYVFGGSIQDLANIGAPLTASPEMLQKGDRGGEVFSFKEGNTPSGNPKVKPR